MRYLSFIVTLSLGLTGCQADRDDVDAVEDMVDMPQECAENEQQLFPGCPPFSDPRPELYGCYLRCEEADCPSGMKCIEGWRNPCADLPCTNCLELVQVCVEDDG